MFAKLKRSLVKHEKLSNKIYPDSNGNLTGAIGYNFTARGIPDWFIDQQFSEDANFHYAALSQKFPWFLKLNEDRQIALTDMSYNLGFKGFEGFTNLITALAYSNWPAAHDAMLDSKWAIQVKDRAPELANVILTGTYKI